MNELNLKAFCAVDDPRDYLERPFKVDDLVVASNGHVMITKPLDGEYPEVRAQTREVIREIIARLDTAEFQPLPAIEVPEKVACATCGGAGAAEIRECMECDGDGEVEAETDYNIYDVICNSCDGDGRIVQKGDGEACPDCEGEGASWDRKRPVTLLGVKIDVRYFMLIGNVPGVEVSATDDGKMLLFRCGDWRGAIMTLKF